MKTAKTSKIILFVMAVAMFFASFLALSAPQKASAATTSSNIISSIFSGTAVELRNVELKDDSAVASMQDGDTLSLKNQLVISDLGLEFGAPDWTKMESFSISIEATAKGANGNINSEGKFDTKIKNVITISKGDSDGFVKASLNEATPVSAQLDGDVNVAFTVDANGYPKVYIEGEEVTCSDEYYTLGKTDKYVGNISFSVKLTADNNEASELAIKSIDQKQSNASGYFKQTFKLDAGGAIEKHALPRVTINDSLFYEDKIVAISGQKNELRTTAYSVTGQLKASRLSVTTTSNSNGTNGGKVFIDDAAPKAVTFYKKDAVDLDNTMSFNISYRYQDDDYRYENGDYAVCEEYTAIDVIAKDFDENAPVYAEVGSQEYIDNADILDAYLDALYEAVTEDYGAEYGVHSVRLGTSINIPSLADFVKDEYTSYTNLTHTIYYKTPSTSTGSSTSWKFTASVPGNYEFYVTFCDKADNKMQRSDFYTAEGQEVTVGKYYDNNTVSKYDGLVSRNGYVFRFVIEDDAPLSVEAAESYANGYVNTRYIASSFDVKASGLQTTYKLYYNASQSAQPIGEGWQESWVEIPTSKKVSESNVPNGWSLDDTTNVAYDGKLTFTPVKKGTYVIECSIASNNVKDRKDTAVATIRVDTDPTIVKPANTWLRDNVWSVVFLSIGTVCLAGVIVLLFIKPKEKATAEDA